MKKLILNADNFGINNDYNRAVLNGCNNGFLKSASIVVNGETFNAAINEIIPECPKLGVGICFNITQGKALTKCSEITDNHNNFNSKFFTLLKLCKSTAVLNEIEKEFRTQLNKIPTDIKITHIDSLDNIHAIPEIFEIVCKLANEYNIPFVVTHNEKYCFKFNNLSLFMPKVVFNLMKSIILKIFTIKNKKTLNNHNLKTNDYMLGIMYSGIITEGLIQNILAACKEKDLTIHVKLTPCSYLRNLNDNRSRDFKLTQDKIFEDNIIRQGFDIVNYK